jgi:uncharacterized protein (DUF3820 family)
MPFGKWKGVRIALLPNDYLSWLTTTFVATSPEWGWLRESLAAELRHRGLKADLPGPQLRRIVHIVQTKDSSG